MDDAQAAVAQAAVARHDPDTLLSQIERTRENLAQTIDAIADRVSPAHAARRALDRARDRAGRADVRAAVPVGVVVVVVTIVFVAWRRQRR